MNRGKKRVSLSENQVSDYLHPADLSVSVAVADNLTRLEITSSGQSVLIGSEGERITGLTSSSNDIIDNVSSAAHGTKFTAEAHQRKRQRPAEIIATSRDNETRSFAGTSIGVQKSFVSRETERTALSSESGSTWSLNSYIDAWLSSTPNLTASTHSSGKYFTMTTCDRDVTVCCKHVDRRPQPELIQRARRIWGEVTGCALDWNIYVANGFHDLIDKGQRFKSFMPLRQDRLVCGQYLRAFRSCLHYYTHNQCETAMTKAGRLAPFKIYKLEVGQEIEILEKAYVKTRHLDRFFEKDPLRVCQGKIGSCADSTVPAFTEDQLAVAEWIYRRLTGRTELDWDIYSLNQEYWRKSAIIIADLVSGLDTIVLTRSHLTICQKYFSAFRVHNLVVHGQGNCPAVRRRIDVRHVQHDPVNGTRLEYFQSTFDAVKVLLNDLDIDYRGNEPDGVASEFAKQFVEIPNGPDASSLED